MTLAPRWILNGLDLTAAPFLVEQNGSDHGAPETVRSVLASMLADGDIDLIDRHGNRHFEIPVLMEGSLDEMAAAEALLVAAVTPERGMLVFEPGDGVAQSSVFETFAGELVLEQNEDADSQGLRRARVTIPCRPFARPAAETAIDAAGAIGTTTTTVDDGTSTTGWSLIGASATTVPAQHNLLDADAWVADANAVSFSQDGTFVSWAASTAGNSFVRSNLMTVAPGSTYRTDIGFNAGGPSEIMGFVWRWYLADGVTQVGGDQVFYMSTPTGGYTYRSEARVAPAGAVRLRILPFQGAVGAGDNCAITAFSVRLADEQPQGFFDGNSTDTLAITYSWDGTANQSPSTGTWAAPTLAVSTGGVKGTTYGRLAASIRRAGAISMGSTPYLRIKGTAGLAASPLGWGGNNGLVIEVSDNGTVLAPFTYSATPGGGPFEVVFYRPGGFTTVDVTARPLDGSTPTLRNDSGSFIRVDSIEKTDSPFSNGKVQTRQVAVYGSQRTELSLSVLGLDGAGTTPVGLGEQVLVHTAAKGTDGRAKFLSCRAASGLTGTTDSTATSGVRTAIPATDPYTTFTFPAGSLLPGNYLAVARVKTATAGETDLYMRAWADPSTGDNVYDPADGGWKTAPLVAVASGAVWPQVNTGSWVMLPIGTFRLPPADMEDSGATVTVQIARLTNAVDVDDVFLLNADIGQASMLLTGLASGSYSAVRLDAATVVRPQASAWLGVANGTLVADASRWLGEQHSAEPGLLQVSTVTPGCATSRVSASYFRHFHTHVADGL